MPISPQIPIPPEDMAHEKDHRRQLARGVANALRGKLNATTTITLTASSTTSTLSDSRITANSVILFMPTTAHAVTAAAALYVGTRTRGSATLTHASSVNADQTFGVLIIG